MTRGVPWCLLVWTLAWGSAWAGPVKLGLEVLNEPVSAGGTARLRLALLDGRDQPAAGERAWDIEIAAQGPAGEPASRRLHLAPGLTTREVALPLKQPGIIEVTARHGELRDGSVLVRVLAAEPENADEPERRPRVRRPASAAKEVDDVFGIIGSRGVRPQLELRIAPQRVLLADGRDSATVYGFLTGDLAVAPRDLELRFHADQGVLEPTTATIPQGGFSARAQLTARHPGEVTVEFLGARPKADLQGEPKLRARFGAPIAGLKLKASPPVVSLMETAEVVARLVDAEGVPLATESPRQISFTIEAGGGQLTPAAVTIPAGSAETRATLQPTRVGPARIAAASPDLVTTTIDLRVEWPLALLLASALGGLAGGLVAFLTTAEARWWRTGIGLLTGFVLYWAVVFAGLVGLSPGLLLNPLSAFGFSVLGGWLGTRVFAPLLKKWGLPA